MYIVTRRKIFFTISFLLMVLSFLAPVFFGFHVSTDFLGGSILEVRYEDPRPEISVLRESLASLSSVDLGNFSLRPTGEDRVVLRSKEISQQGKASILAILSQDGKLSIKEERFNSVGPIVGESLKRKSYIAIVAVILSIVLFITFAFRKVSKPVSSWKYGLATIIALFHDVAIPTGVYITLGSVFGWEIDLLFVTALLAILGYSVHDTIVVFDRVREHLRINEETHTTEDFEVTVGKSLRETMGRSINTSVTIFITLLALLLIGSSSTQSFAFILLVGVVVGTYSSIFIASPLLVSLEKFSRKK